MIYPLDTENSLPFTDEDLSDGDGEWWAWSAALSHVTGGFGMQLPKYTIAVEADAKHAARLLTERFTFPLPTRRIFHAPGGKVIFHFRLPRGVLAPEQDVRVADGALTIRRRGAIFIAPGSSRNGERCAEVFPGSKLSPAPEWLLQELAKV